MSENGEIYTTGKNFTLPAALRALINLTSGANPNPPLPQLLFVCCDCDCEHCGVLSIRSGNDTSSSMLIVDFKR